MLLWVLFPEHPSSLAVGAGVGVVEEVGGAAGAGGEVGEVVVGPVVRLVQGSISLGWWSLGQFGNRLLCQPSLPPASPWVHPPCTISLPLGT